MAHNKEKVAVLGASSKSDKYSNKAVRLLLEHEHHVIPIHPAVKTIEGLAVFNKLTDIHDKVDTLTVYVSETVSSSLQDEILKLNPTRVVFNPGAENTALQKVLEQHGIFTENACTLVLLKTGQF